MLLIRADMGSVRMARQAIQVVNLQLALIGGKTAGGSRAQPSSAPLPRPGPEDGRSLWGCCFLGAFRNMPDHGLWDSPWERDIFLHEAILAKKQIFHATCLPKTVFPCSKRKPARSALETCASGASAMFLVYIYIYIFTYNFLFFLQRP